MFLGKGVLKIYIKFAAEHPYGSRPTDVFFGKGVLKIYIKFTGENPHAKVWFQ